MAVVRVFDEHENPTLTDEHAVRARLGAAGVTFERWQATRPLAPGAPADEVLGAYAPEIERLKREGGYVTADVIDVRPDTQGLEAMLARFRREHWHDEDEVRFILEGRGVFFIHPREGALLSVEVVPGDLLRVPRGTWHWFDLCAERRIRAIRLFQDPAGWTPRYTDSGVDARHEPVCLGPAHVSAAR